MKMMNQDESQLGPMDIITTMVMTTLMIFPNHAVNINENHEEEMIIKDNKPTDHVTGLHQKEERINLKRR